MKINKIFAIIMITVLGVCGLTAQEKKTNIAVVYFSATGTTAAMAKNVAAAMNAELIEIVPEHKYTDEDLNWHNKKSLTTKECTDPKSRPKIANKIDISGYENVIVCYPIWWGKAAKIMYTFMESQNWDNIKLVTLCTSGSSGLGKSGAELSKLAKGCEYKGGKDCTRNSGADIKKYVDGLLRK